MVNFVLECVIVLKCCFSEAKFGPQSIVKKTRVAAANFTFCGDFPEAEQRQVP